MLVSFCSHNYNTALFKLKNTFFPFLIHFYFRLYAAYKAITSHLSGLDYAVSPLPAATAVALL